MSSQPQTQTVFRLTLKDGIEGLHPSLEPVPQPKPYELLIKIHSIALNWRDIAIATSTYPLPSKDQVIPCSDMCGTVIQLGQNVDDFQVGDTVIPPISAHYLYGNFKEGVDAYGSVIDGMLREYIVLPANIMVKIPKPPTTTTTTTTKRVLNFNQWASIICTGTTVWNAFYGNTALKPGDTVLLQGTGGISLTALQIAAAAGATTIITSSSDSKLRRAQALGASHTINYLTHPHWSAEVLKLTAGKGVSHILENGGLGTISQSLECISASGIISLIGFLADVKEGDEKPDILMPALVKAVTVRGVRGGSKEQLEEVVRFVSRHGLDLPVDRVFGFDREGVLEAFRYVREGRQVGKVCIGLD